MVKLLCWHKQSPLWFPVRERTRNARCTRQLVRYGLNAGDKKSEGWTRRSHPHRVVSVVHVCAEARDRHR
jgi:hypothetical protein